MNGFLIEIVWILVSSDFLLSFGHNVGLFKIVLMIEAFRSDISLEFYF